VTFTSPSTVRGFAEALQGSPLPSNVKVVCIGPVTAQAAREAGFPVHAVATTYTIPGLVAAIRSLQSSE
jgi:Uroporphyrinogen-III synthase